MARRPRFRPKAEKSPPEHFQAQEETTTTSFYPTKPLSSNTTTTPHLAYEARSLLTADSTSRQNVSPSPVSSHRGAQAQPIVPAAMLTRYSPAVTSSCVASSPASPSAASAISATANAPFAIRTCDLRRSSASATSAASATTRTSASCAVAKASQMPFTASSVRASKKTVTAVRRL